METFIILLRLIHILGGIFWAGSTFFISTSLGPAIQAMGQEGGRLLQRVYGPGRAGLYMALAASSTVISGILLYVRIARGVNPTWFLSTQGIGLSLASLAGLIAYLHSLVVMRSISDEMGSLSQAIEATGGAPSPQQATQLAALQFKQYQHSSLSAILMAFAAAGMSIAEYLF